jgi:hypothetical protein
VSNRCQAVASGAKAVEIGPSGGTVTSSDGKLSLDIPAGALDGSIVFSVKAATAWPTGAVGQVYEVEPSGTRFSQPATIALSYAGLNIDAATAAKLFVGTAVGPSWQSLGTAVNDARAQTVASTTTHLSVFGLVAFGAGTVDAGIDVGNGGGSSAGGAAQAGSANAGGIDNAGGRIDGAGGTTGGGGFSSTAGSTTGGGGFLAGGTTSGGGRAGGGGVQANGGTQSGGAGATGTGGLGSGGFPSGGTTASGGFPSGGTTASGGFTQAGGFGPGGVTTAMKDAGVGGSLP